MKLVYTFSQQIEINAGEIEHNLRSSIGLQSFHRTDFFLKLIFNMIIKQERESGAYFNSYSGNLFGSDFLRNC